MMAAKFVRPEILRPPSEAYSYFLPLTYGCSNHKCTFCRFYGAKLVFRDIEAVKKEIDAMHLYLTQHIVVPGIDDIVYYLLDSWDGKKIFLQDGDALVYPFEKLKEVLECLNSKFPNVERIASYATPEVLLKRSVEQLQQLRDLKLTILYMGVESGDDDVLQYVCKGVNHEQIIEAGRKVKESGITLSVTVILGLGGKEGSEKHVLETIKALNAMDPDYVGALTLTITTDAPIYQDLISDKFHPITPFETLEELKMMIENSGFTHCFFSSVHASNYLTVRGILPDDKERMLAQINKVLATRDPALLRPEYLRGL
jgi:radical SAM superfamily enzyme YgiQ (UPF0313 family)